MTLAVTLRTRTAATQLETAVCTTARAGSQASSSLRLLQLRTSQLKPTITIKLPCLKRRHHLPQSAAAGPGEHVPVLSVVVS